MAAESPRTGLAAIASEALSEPFDLGLSENRSQRTSKIRNHTGDTGCGSFGAVSSPPGSGLRGRPIAE